MSDNTHMGLLLLIRCINRKGHYDKTSGRGHIVIPHSSGLTCIKLLISRNEIDFLILRNGCFDIKKCILYIKNRFSNIKKYRINSKNGLSYT